MEKNEIFNAASSFNKFWDKEYYQNEPKFNCIYSINNLPEKIKDGTFIINEYADVDTHWTALFCKRNETVFFNSFGVQHVPKEIKKFIRNKNIKANIFRVQVNSSIMCGYFFLGFIDFMLAGKRLTNFTSLFSPYDFKKMTI